MNRLAAAVLVGLALSLALAGALYYRTTIEPDAFPVVDGSEASVQAAADEAAAVDEAAAGARPDIGFRSAAEYNTGGEPFHNAVVDELMATLDELLARPETAEVFEREAGLHLWRYSTRLASGYLTPEQDTRVLAHLERLAAAHPEHAELFENTGFMVANLMLGKEAPNIVGNDFEDIPFELTDYRGKIVAIVFTGHWCGPCRGEYPYQRLLLEVVDEEDFALLGVNSDGELQVAQDAKAEERLDYRTWWDGHAEEATDGPIANLYNVSGWPTIYVLDEDGVIRNRGARHEKLITVVKDLVTEMKRNRVDDES